MKTITRQELWDALQSGEPIIIVETLPRGAYDSGHLPGALQLAVDEINTRAHELLPDRDARIVVYCTNVACRASTGAQAMLAKLGYTDVAKYAGGKQDWQEAGLPLETTVATERAAA